MKKEKKLTFSVKTATLDFKEVKRAMLAELLNIYHFPDGILPEEKIFIVDYDSYGKRVGGYAAGMIFAEIQLKTGLEPDIHYHCFDPSENTLCFTIDPKTAKKLVAWTKKENAPENWFVELAEKCVEIAACSVMQSDFVMLTDEAEYIFDGCEKTSDIVSEFKQLENQGKLYIEAMNFSERSQKMVAEAMGKLKAEFCELIENEMDNMPLDFCAAH